MPDQKWIGYITYTYDLNGSCTSMTYADGTKVTYAYDECGLLINETVTNPDGETILSYAYTYGNCGECLSVVETDEEATITTTYSYDKLLRLTSETITDGNGTLTISYTYDNVGNRLSKTTAFTGEISSFAGGEVWAVYQTGTITYTYNELNQLITETSEDGTNTYAYDENGNLTSLSGEKQVSYTYNSLGYLAEATITSGGVTTWESYTYDGEGNRVSVTTRGGGRLEPETTYYVNDACSSLTQVLATVDENGNVKQTYQRGLGLISYNEEETTTYYVSDGRGSVTALLKEGSITDRYHYDAYGNLIKKSGSSENEYLYNGESYSETTGLYYQRARYMNPTTGTFISMDAYSGTTDNPVSQHKYLYANANPVMYEDPSGYSVSLAEMSVASAMNGILNGLRMLTPGILGAIFGVVDTHLNSESTWIDIIISGLIGFALGMAFSLIGKILGTVLPAICSKIEALQQFMLPVSYYGNLIASRIIPWNAVVAGVGGALISFEEGEMRQGAFRLAVSAISAFMLSGGANGFIQRGRDLLNRLTGRGNQGCVGGEGGNGSLNEGTFTRYLADGRQVTDVTNLPGRTGIQMSRRLTTDEMTFLTQEYGVEFAQVYRYGNGINGRGGQYYLYSGTVDRVTVPIGNDIMLINHTHPGGTAYPSSADRLLLGRYQPFGSPQRSSEIIAIGMKNIRFNTTGLIRGE